MYNFTYYGAEHGLTSLGLRNLFQDKSGYLWVSTEGGIFRYDGTRFRKFAKAEGIPPNVTAAFDTAPDGTLLIACDNRLFRQDREDHFTEIPLPAGYSIGAFDSVRTANDKIYVATTKGILIGSGRVNTGRIAWRPLLGAAGVRNPRSRLLHFDGDTLWYACAGRDLCVLQNGKARVVSIEVGLPNRSWLQISEDGEGRHWLQSVDGELYVRNPGAARFVKWSQPMPALTCERGSVDRAGRFLVNTAEGLAIWSGDRFRIVGRSAGILGPVYGSLQDREGLMWIAVGGRGLAKWSGYGSWDAFGPGDGLESDGVYAVLPLDSTTALAGAESGLYQGKLTKDRWVWKALPGFRHLLVRRLFRARDGSIWLCTEGAGIGRLDLAANTISWLKANNPDATTRDLLVDRNGRLWVATSSGLFAADEQRKRLAPVPGTQSYYALAVAEAPNGDIWAGTISGLLRVSKDHTQFFGTKDGLADERVLSIAFAPDGEMWLGYFTKGAISHGRADGGKLRLQTEGPEQLGLSSIIYFLNFDHQNRLWAGTDQGVRVREGKSWSRYSTEDGLIWNDCNVHAFAEGPDGAVWIGTSAGLARFMPETVAAPRLEPKVVFTGVLAGGKPVDHNSPLVFSHRDNALQISYSALTFARNRSIRFKYRLHPSIEDWRETDARELNFAGLPGGQYRLELAAQNGWGDWSKASSALGFRIEPPFWWTIWAKAVYLLLALAGFAGLFQLRSRRLERKLLEQRKEMEQARILAEAKSQLESFSHMNRVTAISQMAAGIAHEICQPLSAISCNAATALVILDGGKPNLEELRDSVAEILEDQQRAFEIIDRLRRGLKQRGFDIQVHSLNSLVRETVGFARQYAASHNVSLRTELAKGLPRVEADDVKTQQILWNLVQNGVDALSGSAGPERILVIRTMRTEGGLLIEVEDNGPGISDADKTRIFEPLFTTKQNGLGMGLAICNSIAQGMGGRIWVENGKTGGACFRVLLPAAAGQQRAPGKALQELNAISPQFHEEYPLTQRRNSPSS